ncbi:WhiB family transcriptional regulator [Aeromicrobium sp. Leaf350]|uniref:WhiB family transcriptional regulator n=1 Tax=Aeromicrobium sp. Leaf350 TaxID=2876565 RepID=UPI001E412264|nr:WhiB family transcriptional regulator [Aeromicrobium sp. Leaf350]
MPNLKRLPMPLIEVYEWQHSGACMGLDSSVFFSPSRERGAAKHLREQGAKAVCATCPVIEECRDHALAAREPYGVWGGMTVEERELLTRERKAG